MQEHIQGDGSTTGRNIPDDERLKLLKELLPEGRCPANCDGSWKEMHQAAEWERFCQLREDAPIRRRWVCQLQDRSRKHLTEPPKERCLPPIRADTFKLLARPVERDFDRVKFFLMAISVVTMFVSFASQIDQITRLCSTAFMCPSSGAGWKHRPVVLFAT